jgi:hypothetical protein
LWIGYYYFLTVDTDDPSIRLFNTGQDTNQGRLAGAVGADKPMYLSGANIEIDPFESLDTAKVLADVRNTNQGDSGQGIYDGFDTRLPGCFQV